MNILTSYADITLKFTTEYTLGFLTAIELLIFIYVLYAKKLPLKPFIRFALIFPLFVSAAQTFIPSSLLLSIIKAVITSLIFIFGIIYIFQLKPFKEASFYYILFYTFISIPAKFTSHVLVLTDVFNIYLQNDSLKGFVPDVLTHIIIFAILFFSMAVKRLIHNKASVDKSSFRLIAFYIILTILIFATYLKLTFDQFSNTFTTNTSSTLILQFFILIPFILLSIYNITNTINNIGDNKEIEIQKFYNENLDKALQSVRETIHSHGNAINLIYWYVESNEIEELKEYLTEIAPKYKNIETKNAIMFENIKNIAVLGIISAKYSLAIEKNIFIEIKSSKSSSEINEIHMRMSDLTNIIGIFMDNAIEAAEESDEKLIIIDINFTNNEFYFKLINSCNVETMPDMNKIYSRGWSKKGENRGIGLWDVHKTLQRYKNISHSTYIENNRFIQEIRVS